MVKKKKAEEKRCLNCRFFNPDSYQNLNIYFDHGQCRRYPPRRISSTESDFPIVIDDNLCGEWQPQK